MPVGGSLLLPFQIFVPDPLGDLGPISVDERFSTLLSTLIDGLRGIKSNKAMGLQDRLQKYLEQDIEKLADMRKRIILSSNGVSKKSSTI